MSRKQRPDLGVGPVGDGHEESAKRTQPVLLSYSDDRVEVGASLVLLLAAILMSQFPPFGAPAIQLSSGYQSGSIASIAKDRPLAFEEYLRGTGEPMQFLARTASYSAKLEPSRAMLLIPPREGRARSVEMIFVGSDRNATADGRNQLSGTVNYLVGNDPSRWRTGLSRYQRIVFQEIYRGIDLHYYGAGNRLEYDLVLEAGAHPEEIVLQFDGVDELSIDVHGNLDLRAGPERLQLLPPVVFQEKDQVRTRVPAGYELAEGQTVRFRVGEYDRGRELVIDPVLVYSTVLGGTGEERNALVAVDDGGHAYVAGRTGSGNFPLLDPLNDEFGFAQGFISKFDPDGELIFSTYLGGTREERIQDVAVDGDSNIYVTGYTESDDFPTENAFQDTLQGFGSSDAFVSKLAPTGDSFVFSTYLGGFEDESIRRDDQVGAITTDAAGNCYVTGVTESADFPLLNPFQAAGNNLSNRNGDAFVAKFDAVGNLVYSSFLGGSAIELPTDIAVDETGSAYVVGGTDSPDFPLVNPILETAGGDCREESFAIAVACEGFVAKVSPGGDALIYSTYLGGQGDFDSVGGVVVDASGSAHLVGHTSSQDFPSIPAAAGHGDFTRSTLSGETDLFLASLAPDGSSLTYAALVGGGGEELSGRLAIDELGNWCFSGATRSPEFPVFSPIRGTLIGTQDGVVACFNPSTATLLFSTFLGGVVQDFAQDVASNGADVYVSGTADSSRGFPVANPLMSPGGSKEAFITRISLTPGPFLGPIPDQSWTRSIRLDTNQNGRPDPRDEIISVSRSGDNVELSSGRWGRALLELSDPSASGRLEKLETTRFKIRNGEFVASSRATAEISAGDGDSATTASLAVERLRTRPGVRRGQASLIDSDGDQIFDAVRGQGDGYPEVTVSLQRIDINGDGNADFLTIPWSLAQLAGTNVGDSVQDPQPFFPLGDTNGDGIPDSLAADFDNDGVPDPDFYRVSAVAGPGQSALHSLHFAQFGEGGDLLFSQILLFSLDLEGEAQVTIDVRDDNGIALQTDLNGVVVNGLLQATIPAGGLRTFSTDGLGPVVVGSVTVTSDRPIAGVILFGGSVGLAGVGSSSELGLGFLAPIESRAADQIQTGVAIKNLEAEEITLVLHLLNGGGQELATRQLTLGAFGHQASFIDQLFEALDLSDFAGVLKVETGRRITATVLQARPGEFATMPVTALRGGSPNLQFAHFGDGDGLLFSQFLIQNMNEVEEGTAQLRVVDDEGASLRYDLDGTEFTGNSNQFAVSPQGLTILATDGQGPLISGSATLLSGFPLSGPFAGVLLFGGVVGLAGVGSSATLTNGFVAPIETDLGRSVNTGVAIRNLSFLSRGAVLGFSLHDVDGKLLAQTTRSMPGSGHLALFVDQLEWVPEAGVALDFSRFQGTIRVTSDLSLAATVLQTRPGQFATMPVSVLGR